MKKVDLDDIVKELKHKDFETIDLAVLYNLVADNFYFTGITISGYVSVTLGEKTADKYCSSTLVKKLYEGNYIDEWLFTLYFNIKKSLQQFKKEKGYKDNIDLRKKLISINNLINEFCEQLKVLEEKSMSS